MSFNKKLLDIVACPVCKGKLVLNEQAASNIDEDDNDKEAALQLVCRFDRLAYPIEAGIPVLLETASTEMSLEDIETVKKHD